MVDLVTTLGAAAGTYAASEKLNVEDVFSTYLYTGTESDITINNGINLSENGGLTWIKNRSSLSDYYAVDSVSSAPENNWSPIDTIDYRVLDMIWDGTYYFGATTQGGVLRSTDGRNWNLYSTGYGGDSQAIASDGQGNLVLTVTTTQGAVQTSTNYGVSWTKRDNVISNLDWVYAVAYDPVNSLFVAGGQNGFKVASSSNLASWSTPSATIFSGNSNDLLRLQWDSANNRMWALTSLNAANGGSLYYSSDGWNTRTAVGLPDPNVGHNWFWVNEAGDIGVVDGNGNVYLSTDSGSNWTLLSNGYPYSAITDKIGRITYDETNSRWIIANGFWNGGSFQAPTTNLQQVSYWNGTTWVNESYAYGSWNSDYAASINYANGNVFIGTDRSAATYSNNPELSTGSKYVVTNDPDARVSSANAIKSLNSNGFTIGNFSGINASNDDYVSWTFRKTPGFFDIVTWTGTGVTETQTINHNLGTVPGMIIVKRIDATADQWWAWHRGLSSSQYLRFNTQDGANSGTPTIWGGALPTSTSFTVSSNNTNSIGAQYIAYIFAHHDNSGEFGPNGDQDIIHCGTYFGTSSDNGAEINLGFEPQWLLIKSFTIGINENWVLIDVARGMPFNLGPNDDPTTYRLFPNTTSNETETSRLISPLPTGFKVCDANNLVNDSDSSYVYMAIRRPMKVPESADEVFALTTGDGAAPSMNSDWPVDMAIRSHTTTTTHQNFLAYRLGDGTWMKTNNTDGHQFDATDFRFDYSNGWGASALSNSFISWMWRRAPGFFDVVPFIGSGATEITETHNLQTIPEMMWFKRTTSNASTGSSAASDWVVYHKDLNANSLLFLNSTSDVVTGISNFIPSTPTSTTFTLGNFSGNLKGSGDQSVAFLFASLPGISKVGSYTGNGGAEATNGTPQTIDCGFTTGARFVLIKRTDAASPWHVYDTVRGILPGFDSRLELDNARIPDFDKDEIDADTSGFIVNQEATSNINITGADYIFYAIA